MYYLFGSLSYQEQIWTNLSCHIVINTGYTSKRLMYVTKKPIATETTCIGARWCKGDLKYYMVARGGELILFLG